MADVILDIHDSTIGTTSEVIKKVKTNGKVGPR